LFYFFLFFKKNEKGLYLLFLGKKRKEKAQIQRKKAMSTTSTSTVNGKKKRELTEYNHFVRAKMMELKNNLKMSETKLEKGENFKLIGKAWQEYKKERTRSLSTSNQPIVVDVVQKPKGAWV